MKIIFDESGNTGCVTISENMRSLKEQPVFLLGALVLKNNDEENEFLNKYKKWKSRHGIVGEFKGSDLMTKVNNNKLYDFIETIIDDKHFSFNIDDKKFYLSTMIIMGFIGVELQYKYAHEFYAQASLLSLEDDSFFQKYCETIENLNMDSLKEFFEYTTQFEYKYLSHENNLIKEFAINRLKDDEIGQWLSDFMTYGWYDNLKQVNVINLNALGELVNEIKIANPKITNKEINLIHDNILEFEDTFKQELKDLNLSFDSSVNNEFIQIIDNVVSIINNLFIKMIKAFRSKTEWNEENEWSLELISLLLRKIKFTNIKFTVPICDWAVAFCVAEMFSKEFPKNMRKNLFFNPLFMKRQQTIYEEIENRAKMGFEFYKKTFFS